MINFRFHLVSLVGVFLALGVGVAMGASFVDRATVETLRDRLDQLEGNYRERGAEIDSLRSGLRSLDESVGSLFGEGSPLLADRLTGQHLVVVAPSEVSADAVDAAWGALQNAGAQRSGTLRVQPAADLADEGTLSAMREVLGLDSATRDLVRGRMISRLASALSVLTAPAPTEEPAPTTTVPPADSPQGEPAATTVPPTTTTVPPFRPSGPDPTTAEVDAARAYVQALVEAGVISLDTGGAPADGGFPSVSEVTYVMLVEDGISESAVSTIHRLAKDVAEAAPATVTVAEAADPRPAGDLSRSDPDRDGALLVELRKDDEAVDRLSTVEGLEEVVGRVTLVLAVEEQLAGEVGHYGTGVGATGTIPQTGR